MITEAYVSFEVAKLLKEKGFNEPCYGFYGWEFDENDKEEIYFSRWTNSAHDNHFPDEYLMCAAPTHQMAVRWLRETHKLFIEVSPILNFEKEIVEGYRCYMDSFDDRCMESNTIFVSYEEATEAAIKYALGQALS